MVLGNVCDYLFEYTREDFCCCVAPMKMHGCESEFSTCAAIEASTDAMPACAPGMWANELNLGVCGTGTALLLMQVNQTLCELNLRQNYVSDEGAVGLAGVVRGSQSLRVLDVQSNSFRTEGRKALAASFQSNPRVAQAMPLSWHAGQESSHVRAKLAQPPRSLVSVDTAATAPGRRNEAGLQRKKPASIAP